VATVAESRAVRPLPLRWRQSYAGELWAEFFGTFILICFGDGVVAMLWALIGSGRTAGPKTALLGSGDWLLITWGWALAVVFAIYTVGGVTGAHINPAITLSAALRKQVAETERQLKQSQQLLASVSNDLGGVKTDLKGAKGDIEATRGDLEATKKRLETTIGDLGMQSGLIAQTVSLPRTVAPTTSFNTSYMLASPDGQFVYYIDAITKEVFVLDLVQRKFVRQTVLSDSKSRPTYSPLGQLLARLSALFVGSASAKMYAQPGAILSADGKRLYFVDVQDFDRGNGLWAVETATLKMIGHWLTGKDIDGVMLSLDGRELYAASSNDNNVYVLEPLTGETRRALRLDFKPVGLVGAQAY